MLKDTSSKLAGLFSTVLLYCCTASREAVNIIIVVVASDVLYGKRNATPANFRCEKKVLIDMKYKHARLYRL